MGILRMSVAMSLDGYVAGPDQSLENPLGRGGMGLHQWAFELDTWQKEHGGDGGVTNPSTTVVEEARDGVGATIMGRNMFGGGPGPWATAEPWDGWWGPEPPYHHPVFVLTHHTREPLTLSDTTFVFVTDGIDSALEQARASAGDLDVLVGGGADAGRQYLCAGLLDELQLSVAPVLLGAGERLLDGVAEAGVTLEPLRVIDAPGVTHLKYRVGGGAARAG